MIDVRGMTPGQLARAMAEQQREASLRHEAWLTRAVIENPLATLNEPAQFHRAFDFPIPSWYGVINPVGTQKVIKVIGDIADCIEQHLSDPGNPAQSLAMVHERVNKLLREFEKALPQMGMETNCYFNSLFKSLPRGESDSVNSAAYAVIADIKERKIEAQKFLIRYVLPLDQHFDLLFQEHSPQEIARVAQKMRAYCVLANPQHILTTQSYTDRVTPVPKLGSYINCDRLVDALPGNQPLLSFAKVVEPWHSVPGSIFDEEYDDMAGTMSTGLNEAERIIFQRDTGKHLVGQFEISGEPIAIFEYRGLPAKDGVVQPFRPQPNQHEFVELTELQEEATRRLIEKGTTICTGDLEARMTIPGMTLLTLETDSEVLGFIYMFTEQEHFPDRDQICLIPKEKLPIDARPARANLIIVSPKARELFGDSEVRGYDLLLDALKMIAFEHGCDYFIAKLNTHSAAEGMRPAKRRLFTEIPGATAKGTGPGPDGTTREIDQVWVYLPIREGVSI